MRFPFVVLAAAAAISLSGCSEMVSLNPYGVDGKSITDPQFAGTWRASGNKDADRFVIDEDGGTYTIHFLNGKESFAFEGTLFRVGDAELLDLVPKNGDDAFSVPTHTLVRVWPGAGTLQWTFLDSDWLREHARNEMATQKSGDRTLLLNDTETVARFVALYAGDSKAYKETQVLTRVP